MAETKKIYVKRLIIALSIFIVLLLYFVIFELPRKEKESEKNKIFHFVHSDVSKFELLKKDRVIEVERILNDWRINKPYQLAASKLDVDAFIADVRDLSIEKVVGKNFEDLSIFGLAEPQYQLKLWIKGQKNEEVLILKVGNQNPDKSGYYAKLENAPEVYILENFTESILDKDLHYFRDKDIFKIKEGDVEEIKVTYFTQNYYLKKDKDKWNLLKPVNRTNLKNEDVNQVLLPIIDIKSKKFYDFEQKISTAKAGLISPNIKIYLIEKNKKEDGIFIGTEDKDNYGYYAKKIDSDIVFTVDKGIIDDLKNNLEKLKKEETKSTNESKESGKNKK